MLSMWLKDIVEVAADRVLLSSGSSRSALSVRQLLLVTLQSGSEPNDCPDVPLALHAFSGLILPVDSNLVVFVLPSSTSHGLFSLIDGCQKLQAVNELGPVHSPSWMHHQSYLMQPAGTVLTPTMDHAMSIQPTSMMGPLTQQLSHLSLGSTGTYIPANTTMQGTYIPQYTPVPPSSVPVEENGGQQQQVAMETPAEHTNYSYQHTKEALIYFDN
ncbi:hypothetical protein INR49_020526 [Caranx melampygus]|nr:hypothetical protein INR49_020526 [Caranx melampygus]